jgi:hypothetical protein
MDKILVTSIPKSGTHLLISIIAKAISREPTYLGKNADLSQLPSGLYFGHLRVHQVCNFDPSSWKVICLIRDSRDILLSMRDFLKVDRIREKFREGRAHFLSLGPDDQLRYLIRPSGPRINFGPIFKHCSGFIEWSEHRALVVRYREILGGKSDLPIAQFLEIDPHKVEKLREKTIGTDTKTFNKGIVDRWKTEMSQDVLEYFHRHFSEAYLKTLGYKVPFRYRSATLFLRSILDLE